MMDERAGMLIVWLLVLVLFLEVIKDFGLPLLAVIKDWWASRKDGA